MMEAINSLALANSSTTLQAFDGHHFMPQGVFPKFSIELGGKTTHVDVEFIDSPLDYTFLLSRSWFYPCVVLCLWCFI